MSNLGPSPRADETDGELALPPVDAQGASEHGAQSQRAWWIDALLPLLDESWWNHL